MSAVNMAMPMVIMGINAAPLITIAMAMITAGKAMSTTP